MEIRKEKTEEKEMTRMWRLKELDSDKQRHDILCEKIAMTI